MSNPQVNNTFKDQATGLAFLIPAPRQLSTPEATAIVSQWIEQQKGELLAAWKAKKENKDWEGDDAAKKQELFNEFVARRSAGSEILLTWVP